MLSANFNDRIFKVGTTTIAVSALFSVSNDVFAQVVSDLTTKTQVKVDRDTYQITGGIQKGSNLFHSFKQFSLDTNQIANFDRGLDVDNIFSRVTGGTVSNIDGLIQAQGNANLFLINPAGIIFGANARLDIGGSLVATTADRVIFADETQFDALASQAESILTISSPIGLQYGGGGEIEILPNTELSPGNPVGGLNIKAGNTLALLGGDISVAANDLSAVGGNIEIGSVKYGTVDLESEDRGWQFGYDRVKELGQIEFRDRANINASGAVSFFGKTIDFVNGSGIRNFTDANGAGGAINLTASQSIALNNSFLFTQVGVNSSFQQAIADAGGDISLEAPDIFIRNGSVVSAGTLSEGIGGNITLEASKSLELSSAFDNNPSIVSTSTTGAGDGGQIEVNTSKLTIFDGSQIQAIAGKGAGGTIAVDATESIEIAGTGIFRSRNSSGQIGENTLNSGLIASSGVPGLPIELRPEGESGNLIINTPKLTIADSGSISVNNYGVANAGDIAIATSDLVLNTAAEITANTSSGEGGSISVFAKGLMILDDRSAISTTAEQNGNGGNIFIEAENLVLLKSDRISANAQQGNGGNISINTRGLFRASNSSITASSQIDTKEGTIEIVTLDLDSRLSTKLRQYAPLAAGDYIDRGCGVGENFAKNSFRNIGRGGIPSNPLKTTYNRDILADIGQADSKSIESSNQQNTKYLTPNVRSISEANAWKINSLGKVELVASKQAGGLIQPSVCNPELIND